MHASINYRDRSTVYTVKKILWLKKQFRSDLIADEDKWKVDIWIKIQRIPISFLSFSCLLLFFYLCFHPISNRIHVGLHLLAFIATRVYAVLLCIRDIYKLLCMRNLPESALRTWTLKHIVVAFVALIHWSHWWERGSMGCALVVFWGFCGVKTYSIIFVFSIIRINLWVKVSWKHWFN